MARLAVLFAAVCFGTTGTAQALGPDGTEPLAVGAARILVGAALLLLVALRLPASPGAWAWRPLLAAGVGVAAYQLAFFTAVEDTGVAVGTVVAIGSGPAFAGLLGRAVNGERLTRRWGLATGLACAGVALLVGGGEAADVSAPGVGLALLAGASYATYTVAAKALLTAGHAPEAVMARAFTLGAVLLLPLLVVTGGGGLDSPGGLALVLFLGAVPTALAYVLFARGLQRLSSGETATLTLAEPLTATILGIAVLGEDPTPLTAAGAALVLGGLLVLAARGPRDRLEAPVPVEAVARCGASSAVATLAAALREAILDGALAGGERLREQALADAHDAARHTVRAALRQLEAEGLVRIAPNAGARVTSLAPEEIADLSATRTLLEVGAVRLALERHGGVLPPATHAAAERFAALCRATAVRVPMRVDPSEAHGRSAPGWGAIVLEHARFHEALVAAAGSPRLTRAHAALSNELALFLVQGRPHFSPGTLAEEHEALVRALEDEGPRALEAHLASSAAALLTTR